MLNEPFTKRCLQLFFLTGVSSYNPSSVQIPIKTRMASLRNALPSTSYILVAIIAGFWAIYEGSKNAPFSFDYFSDVVFITLIIAISTAVYQRIACCHSSTYYVWDHLLHLERVLCKQIHLDIQLTVFRSAFIRKVCIVYIIKCALSAFDFYYFTIETGCFWQQFSLYVLSLQGRMASVYVLFYITLLNHLIRSMNRQLFQLPSFQVNASFQIDTRANAMKNQYQTIKDIHFKLWETIIHMNEEFGFILVALTIHNTNSCELLLYKF